MRPDGAWEDEVMHMVTVKAAAEYTYCMIVLVLLTKTPPTSRAFMEPLTQ